MKCPKCKSLSLVHLTRIKIGNKDEEIPAIRNKWADRGLDAAWDGEGEQHPKDPTYPPEGMRCRRLFGKKIGRSFILPKASTVFNPCFGAHLEKNSCRTA